MGENENTSRLERDLGNITITVEPLTAKVRWPLLGGGRYSEVAALRGSTVPRM